MKIQEGKPAPSFTLEEGSGKKVSLADFAGKNVILYFYPKDDTPGCTKEACGFRDDWKDLQKENAVVLGCSADTAGSHRKFIEKYKLKLRLLSDPEHKLMSRYGAWGEKMLYGKKTIGVIRSTVLIDPEGKVAYHWAKVKSKGHAEKVREKLAELQGAAQA